MNRSVTDILQSIAYFVELRATTEDLELQNHLDAAIEALKYCAGVREALEKIMLTVTLL